MTPNERFEVINRLVDEALDLPERLREAFVRERCGTASDLAAEVFELLALAPSIDALLTPADDPLSDIRPGEVLGGRFRLLEEIGSGGAGAVFLAEDRYLGPVALKIVHLPMSDGCAAERVAAEVGAARGVRHPNVCPVFDLHMLSHERGGVVTAFTMKYLAGETLAAKLSRGPVHADEFLPMARAIASGIDALHAAGIVHRDLKPGNIVVTAGEGGPEPVIVDFGLAVSTGAAQGARLAGSTQYMAPEQFRREPLSKASDLYAFGLVLYEMIAGSRPFPDEDLLAAAIRRNLEDAPGLAAAASWAPRAWEEGIRRALARDPQRRPHSAREVVGMMTAAPGAGSASRRLNRGCRHTGRRLARRRVGPGKPHVHGR